MKSSAKKILLVLLTVLLVSAALATVSFASAAETVATTAEKAVKTFDFNNIDPAVDPLVSLIKNFSVDNFLKTNAGKNFTIGFIILAVFGLAECFLGQKLLRVEIFLLGLVAGAYGGAKLLQIPFINNLIPAANAELISYIVMAVCGAIVGILLCKLVRLGVIAGIVFLTYVVGMPIVQNAVKGFNLPDFAPLLITVIIGLIIGFIVIKLLDPALCIITPLLGGYLLSYCAGAFVYDLFNLLPVIIMAVLFLLGMLLQFKIRER